MAMVTSLVKDDRTARSAHPTRIEARYLTLESDGNIVLQINSYGSDTRDVPGKLSQTLQFDEHSARQLFDVLKKEFGF